MLRVFQMWMMLFLTDNNDVVFEHVAADVVDVAAGCVAAFAFVTACSLSCSS